MNVLAGLALLIILGFIANLVLDNYTGRGNSIQVPDVKGMDIVKAKKILSEKGLRFQIADSVYFEEFAKNSITEQEPQAGEKVKTNRMIYLTMNSSDPPEVEMPDLKDMSLRQAEGLLENQGLRIGEIIYRPSVDDDLILSQKIKAGTKILKGMKIDLVVGKNDNDEQVEIPDLSGLSLVDAKAKLDEMELNVGAIIPSLDDRDSSAVTIYKQKPNAGKQISKGGEVDIFIK